MLAAVLRRASLAMLIVFPLAAHAAGRGTVRSTAAVNVREQPNLNSAVIVALRKGRVVTVDKVLGQWVLITLDSGRKGYVKAALLEIEPQPAVAVAATATAVEPAMVAATPPATASLLPSETPASTASGTAAIPAESAERPTPEAPHDTLQHEVARLRDRLTALESVMATPDATLAARGAQGSTPGRAAVHERDALRPADMEPEDIGPSLALAGVGLVIGFLLGAAYGRRQERNRRARVRF